MVDEVIQMKLAYHQEGEYWIPDLATPDVSAGLIGSFSLALTRILRRSESGVNAADSFSVITGDRIIVVC